MIPGLKQARCIVSCPEMGLSLISPTSGPLFSARQAVTGKADSICGRLIRTLIQWLVQLETCVLHYGSMTLQIRVENGRFDLGSGETLAYFANGKAMKCLDRSLMPLRNAADVDDF
jgi:hypothetical protein